MISWLKARILRGLHAVEGLEWLIKVRLLWCLLGLALFLLGPVSFWVFQNQQVRGEALDRAAALVRLLAASNQLSFRDKQDVLYSVDEVAGQVGVEDAYVVDASGMFVAPLQRFGQQLEPGFAALHKKSEQGLHIYQRGPMHYILTYPITLMTETAHGLEQDTPGVAFLHFNMEASVRRLRSLWAQALTAVLLLVLILWILDSVLRRWTLFPLRVLQEQAAAWEAAPILKRFPMRALHDVLSQLRMQSPSAAVGLPGQRTFFEQLRTFSSGDLLILDAQKKIVMSLGRIGTYLRCEIRVGLHILSALSHSPLQADVLAVLMALDEHPTGLHESTSTSGFVLQGLVLQFGSETYYALAVTSQSEVLI